MILHDIGCVWYHGIYIYICISMLHDHSNDQRHITPWGSKHRSLRTPIKGTPSPVIHYTAWPLEYFAKICRWQFISSHIHQWEKRNEKPFYDSDLSSWNILDFMQKQECFFSNIAWWPWWHQKWDTKWWFSDDIRSTWCNQRYVRWKKRRLLGISVSWLTGCYKKTIGKP